MASLQFDEEPRASTTPAFRQSRLIRLTLATGIVSTEEQARYLLVAVAILGLVLSGYLFGGLRGFFSHAPQKAPAEQPAQPIGPIKS